MVKRDKNNIVYKREKMEVKFLKNFTCINTERTEIWIYSTQNDRPTFKLANRYISTNKIHSPSLET